MKTNPNPRLYTREQARRLAKRYARMKTAEIQSRLETAEKAITEMVSHTRRIERTWRDGVAKNPFTKQ